MSRQTSARWCTPRSSNSEFAFVMVDPSSAVVVLQPPDDEIRDLVPAAVLEVVLTGHELQTLVAGPERVVDGAGIARIHTSVRERLDDEGRNRHPRQVLAAVALRILERPHRQPGPEGARSAQAERAVVRPARVTGVATGLAVARVERQVAEARVRVDAMDAEDPVEGARVLQARQLGVGPLGDAVVACDLGGAVALDEVPVVRNLTTFGEEVERRVDRERV